MNQFSNMEHISTIFMALFRRKSLYFNYICFSGPGNMHFDHGQDVFFIKTTREYAVHGTSTKDVERRCSYSFFATLKESAFLTV